MNPEYLEGKPKVWEPEEKHDTIPTSTTLRNLRWLSKQPDSQGKIDVKLMNEEPRFNIIAIDPELAIGTIFVEFFPQRHLPDARPRMELIRERDGYWFNYFNEQFDRLWKDYEPTTLDTLTKQLKTTSHNTHDNS